MLAHITSLDQEAKHHFYFSLYETMTPAQRRIVMAYHGCWEKQFMGEYLEITPSRKEIAKRAKCSESSVRDFIKKFEGEVFDHQTRRAEKSYKHNSNKYFLNFDFFEFLALLKINNYLHRWKNKRKEIFEGLINDDHFLARKAIHFYRLSTTKLPTGYVAKLPAINSLLRSTKYSGTSKDALMGGHQKSVQKNKEPDIFDQVPLTYAQKEKLKLYNATIDIRQALQDRHKFTYVWGNKINNEFMFIRRQAEKSYEKRKEEKNVSKLQK